MPKVTWEEVKSIWNKTPASSWNSLLGTLMKYQEGSMEINQSSLDWMIEVTKKMYYAGEPFPDSVEKLYEIFNLSY